MDLRWDVGSVAFRLEERKKRRGGKRILPDFWGMRKFDLGEEFPSEQLLVQSKQLHSSQGLFS